MKVLLFNCFLCAPRKGLICKGAIVALLSVMGDYHQLWPRLNIKVGFCMPVCLYVLCFFSFPSGVLFPIFFMTMNFKFKKGMKEEGSWMMHIQTCKVFNRVEVYVFISKELFSENQVHGFSSTFSGRKLLELFSSNSVHH